MTTCKCYVTVGCSDGSIVIMTITTTSYINKVFSTILKKARAVATESDHPLSTFFHVLPSHRRYLCITCKTSRYSRKCVPAAIIMLNAK